MVKRFGERRWHPRTVRWLIIGLIAAVLQGCASGRIDRKTADARYKLISDNMDKLVTGGHISQVRWSDDGTTVSFTREGEHLRFDLINREWGRAQLESESTQPDSRPQSRPAPGRGRQRDREPSPDGKWNAVCKDWNVVLEPLGEDEDRQAVTITTDGNRKFRYGSASWVYGEELDQHEAMWWSPDSTKLVFYEFDERQVPDHFLTAGLTDLHTRVLTEGYPKPGEPNPIANLLIYDLESAETTRVELPEDAEWYTYAVQFSPDGKELLFNRTNRHQSVLHVVAADISTGKTRIILTEEQPTWQDNRPEMRFLADGHRFIWETEKTGWKQYELRDLDGQLINTLTHGEYPVSSIERVDEEHGVLFYMAYSDANPLNAQLHRVNLDGTGQVRLTQVPFNHSVRISPDGKWFITEYEAVDQPPTTILCDADGKRIATLAQSNASRFKRLGLEMPELFTFKADDGMTDLYGVLYKPSNFHAWQKYPLAISVYGGPLSQSVRNRFSPAQAECEYGMLIAEIDNRGTTNRGKAFESANYLKLGVIDIKDQADGVRYLAKRPYVDGKHVGIFGHSYGGYMSALAVLKYPDVFQVAAAGGTVTDWRNYDTIYTERYMRTPQENPEGYAAGSCLKYAQQLKGHLLLLHGMLDDNVHPNNIWQLIDKLQAAGKRFEMMFYPDSGHSLGHGANKARWDFLRKYLVEQPG